MKKNKSIILLILLIFAIGLTGCEKGTNIQKDPLGGLKKAQSNMYNLSAIKQKIKTETDKEIDGIENTEAIVTYDFNTDKGYIETESDGKVAAIFVDKDKMYVKDGETDKYVDLSDSIIKTILLSTINSNELNKDYKTLNDEISNLMKPENVSIEDAELTINEKNKKVKKITATMPQEEANKILSKYMENIMKNMMNGFIEQMTEYQISTEEKITGKTISDEEKAKIKDNLTIKMNEQMQKQLKAMNFSDIKYVFYVKDNIILKSELIYNITVDGEKSNVKTTSEILEYGKDVKCPEVPKDKIISIEDFSKTQPNNK